jgi:membrane associated rhomboid family serine protease
MIVFRRSQGPSTSPIWALIGLNVVFFIATLINQDLIFLLGFNPSSFLSRPWTIITSLFVHGGFWHIIANMITLYFFGRNVLSLVGRNSFLAVYFIGGIIGNILFMLLAPVFTTAVGASGAIFALGGALAVMRPKLKALVFPIPVPLPLWVVVIGGFIVLSFVPNIAWQAHLGGLVVGAIAGYFFRRRERRFASL